MSELADFIKSDGFRNGLAFTAVLIALVSVLSSRNTAKKKQTADMLFSSRTDQTLVEAFQKIATTHLDTTSNIRKYAGDGTDAAMVATIRYILNHFENVAVGIQAGIYDEKMLKSAIFTPVTTLYDRTRPFIEEMRTLRGKPTIYQEFEWLACKWKSKPLASKKNKVPS